MKTSLIAALACSVPVSAAHADGRRFTMSGTIEATSGSGPPFTIGDPYVVQYLFNTETPDANPSPSIGAYAGAIVEANGAFGAYPFNFALGDITVQDNVAPGDVYDVLCPGAGGLGVYLADSESASFQGDALPTDLNVALFEQTGVALHVHGAFGHWNASGRIVQFAASGACVADCTGDGSLTVADFVCFQGVFVAGGVSADCNLDAHLTIADFVCFQGKFVAGCP